MAAASPPLRPSSQGSEKEDQTQLLIARLMEGGQEDDETCRDLDSLTSLLNEDAELSKKTTSHVSICNVIDADCVDTLLGYLDMRQSDIVRGHATLTTSSYLKAAGDAGSEILSNFFQQRVHRGRYDDYIVAFCVAAAIFPIVPDLTAQLFLSEGFLGTLGPLMRRKWKSKKVETACLEMLNAACMHHQCREAVQKYCSDFLEEIVDQDPDEAAARGVNEPDVNSGGGSVALRRHSLKVQQLAAVILAKIRAIPQTQSSTEQVGPKIELATTSIEDLSSRFTAMLLEDDDQSRQYAIEGLAYASIQSKVKDSLAQNPDFLKRLVQALHDAPPKSPMTYGALSILVNLTRYRPNLSEEQAKMKQLKAYANAEGKSVQPDPLNDNDQVSKRCAAVFEAGVTPVLVTHSKNGSVASLSLIAAIMHSLSFTHGLRGKLAQQGAVKLLLTAWSSLPEADVAARRVAAQALARILISTDPSLVFGGTRAQPQPVAVRPLVYLLTPDLAADTRDLLPSFEALMALTNLASAGDEETIGSIIRTGWPQVEDLLLSSNQLICKAAVELLCNVVQIPEGVALYADGSPQAKNRLHILLALADSPDEGTRSAAGGALASLTAYEEVVLAVAQRERGIKVLLDMCADDNADLLHRGVFIIRNLVCIGGEAGTAAMAKVKDEGGLEVLKESARKTRNPQVFEVAIQALKALMGEEK